MTISIKKKEEKEDNVYYHMRNLYNNKKKRDVVGPKDLRKELFSIEEAKVYTKGSGTRKVKFIDV